METRNIQSSKATKIQSLVRGFLSRKKHYTASYLSGRRLLYDAEGLQDDFKPPREIESRLLLKKPRIDISLLQPIQHNQAIASVHKEIRYDRQNSDLLYVPDPNLEFSYQNLSSLNSTPVHSPLPLVDLKNTRQGKRKIITSGFSHNFHIARSVYMPGTFAKTTEGKCRTSLYRKRNKVTNSQQKIYTPAIAKDSPLNRVLPLKSNPYSMKSNQVILKNHFGVIIKSSSTGYIQLKKAK